MRPVSIPNTFQTKTGQIPLSQLDSNFTTLATAINDVNTGNAYYVDSSGTPNQIVVTTPSNVTAVYQAGLTISVQVGNTNTATAVTININGQGATNLANVSGTNGVAIGQITALDIINLVFDGTSFIVTGGSGLATSTLSMSLAGNFAIPAPTSGVALTVNGLNAVNTILAQVPNGQSAQMTAYVNGTSGGSTVSAAVGSQVSIGMIANYSGVSANGIPNGSAGIVTFTGSPLVLCAGTSPRITFGVNNSSANTYQFGNCLLSTSATAGSNGATPAQVAGYLNLYLNGNPYKIAYYNP